MDSETIAALASGQLVLRDLLAVYAADSEGEPVTFGLWSGIGNITTNVISPLTGGAVSRNFVGGTLVSITEIVDSIGLDERPVTVSLNHLHATVKSMVRGHTIRMRRAEIWRGVYSPATGALVSEPLPLFMGRVSTAPMETAAADGEGGIELDLLPHHVDLTRTNPAMKSDETQRLRDGDRLRRYADTAGQIDRRWGQHSGAAEEAPKKKGGLFGLGLFG